MRAFRDKANPIEAHSFVMDGVTLTFDQDGLLVEPTEAQEAVMKSTALRQGRFEEVQVMGKSPDEGDPVSGDDFAAAAIGRKPRKRKGEGAAEE